MRSNASIGAAVLVVVMAGLAAAQTPSSGVVELPRTGLRTCYGPSGLDISCARTHQDGDLQAGVAWPIPRFSVGVAGEADCVTDNLTGLMWPRTSGFLLMAWADAIDRASNEELCGHDDWLLPNINQLETLTHAGLAAPDAQAWLGAQGMNRYNQGEPYWSSTSADADRAWYVEDGQVRHEDKGVPKYVLPVRVAYPGRLPRTGQLTSYRAGDDGDLQQGVPWPSPRFTRNEDTQGLPDGTVTDNLTGLTWLEDANCIRTFYPAFDDDWLGGAAGDGHVSWEHALGFVLGLNAWLYPACGAGHTDWRLPNRKELMSLVDRDRSDPALPSGPPYTNVQTAYWTSGAKVPPAGSGASEAWAFDTADGTVVKDWIAGAARAVWPVRGGRAGFVRAITGVVHLAGTGLPDVTVTLNGVTATTPGGPSAIAITTTAADGTYRFDDLADGDYAIRPGQDGFAFTPENPTVTVAGADAQQDFSAYYFQTYSIAGMVTDTNTGAGAGGVTLALSGPVTTSTITASDGSYRLPGLPAGTYTVSPSRAGYLFDPRSATVPVADANAQQDFLATRFTLTASKPLIDIGSLEVGRLAAGRMSVTTTGPADIEVRIEAADVNAPEVQALLSGAGYDATFAVSDASAVRGYYGESSFTSTISGCAPCTIDQLTFYFHPAAPVIDRVSVAKVVVTAYPPGTVADNGTATPTAPPITVYVAGRSVAPGDLSAAPAARDDFATTTVSTAVTVDVLANDPGRSGRPLYVSMIGACYLPLEYTSFCQRDPAGIGGTVSMPHTYDRVVMTPQANLTGTMTAIYSASEQECGGCRDQYENTMYFAKITVTVATNLPPTADAGPDLDVAATSATSATVLLSGSGSDPEGQPVTFAWSGPCGTASTATAYFTCDVGTHEMTVTVSDGLLTASDTVTVTVRPNQPPTADAGLDVDVVAYEAHGAAVTLTGSGSDPEGWRVTFAWSGPCGTASTATAYFTCDVGTHEMTLTVSDGLSTASDTVTVTVRPSQPPTADAGPDLDVIATSLAGAEVTLTGIGSDPDRQTLTYAWSGPCGTASRETATFTCPVGTHVMTFTVSDGLSTASDTMTVTVRWGPPDVSVIKQARTMLMEEDEFLPAVTVENGALVAFRLRVRNQPPPGGGPTTGPVTVIDELPAGLSFVAGSSDEACEAAGQVVTCTIAALQPGEGVDLAVFTSVLAPAGTVTTLSNRATVATADDRDSRNNASAATVTVEAPLPLPTGSTLLVTAPAGQVVSNVALSGAPGVQFPFGAISYRVTLGPGETSSRTALTFTPTLASPLVLTKIQADGDEVGIIPECGTRLTVDCWTRQDTLTQTIVTLILTDNGRFDLNAAIGVIDDPVLIGFGTVEDTTPPDLVLGTPAEGAVYTLHQAVAASYACSDGGSGVDACEGTVASGAAIDTSSVGTKTFTVEATDVAGNSSTTTRTYRVVFAGSGPCGPAAGHAILEPIAEDGSTVVRRGRTVPAKFRVCDANGVPIGTPGVVESFRLIQVTAGTAASQANLDVPSATPDTAFRWDPVEQQWIYNISTQGFVAGCTYWFRATLGDGSAIDFRFGVR